ncbi:F-box/kelch-repeat protein At1g23390, partial [Asparagus officinalis]|uniref:F-box/kelch-repeat protein At1g23390 n=1 Tax=Asparagus officinalis TaxID=4686 RepID=UPI00098E48FD
HVGPIPPSLPHVPYPLLPPKSLYSLSPSRLSLSNHPFGSTWIHLPPPRVSRVDPVVAQVGSCVVVAGGACDFENVARAVEVFNLADPTTSWTLCDQIPEDLARSSSATWLSSATSAKLLYVLDKDSGVFSSFDQSTGKWSRTCELKPDRATRVSAIGFSNGRLLLVGLSGSDPDPVSLKIWEVGFCLDLIKFTEIGRMPEELVEGLAGSGFGLTTIGFGLVGDYGYFYNPGDFRRGAVFWEIDGGKWESVEMPDEVDQDPTARIVFGCARVELADLKRVHGVRV